MVYQKQIRSSLGISYLSEYQHHPATSEMIAGFFQMQNVYEGALKTSSTMLEILDAEFQTQNDHNPIHHLESRIKSMDSVLEKMARKKLTPTLENLTENITDIVGLRIICHYVSDIYHLSDLLCNQKGIEVIRKTDYIQSPKANGYRSKHLVIRVPVVLSNRVEQVPVEIQLRTIAMDMWASLEHELHYKSDHQPVEHLTERLRRCAVSLADIDLRMQEIYDHLNNRTSEDVV